MDFISSFQNLISHSYEFAESFCVVNKSIMKLDEVEKMGWKEFGQQSVLNMPPKLYKYYPNTIDGEKGVNYSIQALKNNTVYLSSPTEFDDVYDSDLNVNMVYYSGYRIMEYCNRCGIDTNSDVTGRDLVNALAERLIEVHKETGDYSNAITMEPDTEIKRLNNQVFFKRIESVMNNTDDMVDAIISVIMTEYDDYTRHLRETFRIACFTKSPLSQVMWGQYANRHKGFCVEYSVNVSDERYKEILFNTHPMIYCKTRPEMAQRLAKAQDEEPTDESIWDIFSHGCLRKSIDWVFQDEWRLLLPKGVGKDTGYCVPFFPITRVFLGNRMSEEERQIIIKICNERQIPHVGVMKNPSTFDMIESDDQSEEA